MLKKFWKIILLCILLIIMSKGNVKAEDMNFSFTSDEINVGLNATSYIIYSGGTGTIEWTSADASIATVDNNGVVTGLKIGETTITATRGGETATCTVNVVYGSINIKGNRLTSSANSFNLILNEHSSENLNATVKDGNGNVVNNVSVAWESSDDSIVTVDEKGKINAVKAGNATITAEVPGVSEACTVKVYNEPKFTDFTNAKFETSYDDSMNENLKITGITLDNDDDIFCEYTFVITSNNTKPEVFFDNSRIC